MFIFNFCTCLYLVPYLQLSMVTESPFSRSTLPEAGKQPPSPPPDGGAVVVVAVVVVVVVVAGGVGGRVR